MMKKIGEISVTDQSKIVLAIGEYQNKGERIDLRLFVKDKGKKDKYVPTKGGVFFSTEYLPDFIEIVNRLKDE